MSRLPIRKVLVANRGEIAVRVIRTCRELGIRTVAVYSDADRTMPHVQMADEAYHIGPSPSQESYLRGEKIVDVARRASADAIHPGYGFLSEKAAFARLVHQAGLVFIGPSAESIAMMGDKTEARKRMVAAGVPVVPGTVDALDNVDAIHQFADEHGYPILIKAAAGGGGKGMRVVRGRDDLLSSFRSARSEAASAFGDDRVYAEKYLSSPRHVEIQVLADSHGNIVHLGERECSIQRRHQKIIEESPSVIVDAKLREKMGSAAVNAARACGYVNAGTVEFLVDRDRNFYFLEVNTRLQVEHPVTELRTGMDLVAEQIRIASGEPLGFSQADLVMRGHAIECRIYAEDPENNYLPSTGTVTGLRPAQGLAVRDDRGVEEGGEVSVYYDPLIAKLIVWGRSRQEAIRRMVRALREYEVLGVATNIPLNLAILQDERFVAGDFDTHFLTERPISLHHDLLDPEEEIAVAGLSALLYLRKGPEVLSAMNGSRKTGIRGRDWSNEEEPSGWQRSRQWFMRGR
jgi:acetyl-CoA carboxylase biotin carboxylase subunit